MNTDELLENPEMRLEWVEPWRGEDESGNRVDANVVLSATVADCIKLSRVSANPGGTIRAKPCKLSDKELLDSFIAVNWATVAETEKLKRKIEAGKSDFC